MTSPFVAEVNKLKNMEFNLKKSEKRSLEHLALYDESSDLIELKKQLENFRIRELENVQNDIKSIHKPLRSINDIISEKNMPNLDLKQIKHEMISVQEKIQNIKEKTLSTIDKLRKEEIELNEDLMVLEHKIEDWKKPVVFDQNSFKTSKYNKIDNSICSEVKYFQKFVLENGGHLNGWSEEDHNLFLKMRMKHKNEVQLGQVLHKFLPDISQNQIIKHELWYREYLDLRAKQKESIKDWRLRKSTKSSPAEKTCTVENKRSSTTVKSDVLSRGLMQEKLETWKEEKQRKLFEQHLLKQQLFLKQKKTEKNKRKYQEETKRKIEEWKLSKTAAEEAEKAQKRQYERLEKEHKASQANKLIKGFQMQDEMYVKKKKELLSRTKSLDRTVSSKNNLAERSFERLLQPTIQWMCRTVPKSNEIRTDSCFIKSVPKLAVPQWRQMIQ